MEIHFLRPWWFLGLMPVAWLVWKAWFIKNRQGVWRSVIDPKFQPLLLGEQSEQSALHSARLAVVGLAALWMMAVVGLAGPSLKSVEMPAQKTHQGSVIVLDLSLSMLAQDIQPSRISRVRFKLTDLLKAHPERAFGMVAYAGSAHTIAPVSEDNQTLLGLLPSLNPLIMPHYGSDPLAAMQQAETLLEGANISAGHLIWITDDLEPEQRKAITSWLAKKGLTLSILAVGTESGGTVQIPDYGLLKDDSGAIITPALPYAELEALSQESGAALTPLTLDDSDIEHLLPSALGRIARDNQSQSENQEEKKETVLHRLDDGTAVLLAMLIPLALAYRRGWVFSFALFLVLPAGGFYAPPAMSEWKFSDLTEVFQTPDQQAYKAWKREDYQAAESLFESSQWKGAALYRNGKYPEAAEQFQKDPSAHGRYNLGNALARQGQLQEAKQAYEQALEKQPQLKEARTNLDLVNQLLEQQRKQKENGLQQPTQNTQKEPKNQAEKTGSPSQTSQSKSEEKARQSGSGGKSQETAEPTASESEKADSKKTEKSEQENAQSAENDTGQAAAPNQQKPDSAQTPKQEAKPLPQNQKQGNQNEQQRATDNWLKQIPDQPGLFLKRKFEYQFQNRQKADSQPDNPGKSDKIW